MSPVPHQSLCWELPSEEDAQALAARFAAVTRAPAVFYLSGDLGAGKTTFARAYIHALGYQGYVKSPSYGLLETYRTQHQNVLHLDLYRIEDPEELEFLALRDLFTSETVLMVEWPGQGKGMLPPPDLELEFGEKGESRFVHCRAVSERGQSIAKHISESSSDTVS